MTDKRRRDIDFCATCGVYKTRENTSKSSASRNGLQPSCKRCHANYQRVRRGLKLKKKDLRHTMTGIDSWDQVDSVLRECSELQYKINTETDLCEKRKTVIEEYSHEIIDPCIAHQIGLRTILENFIKKACKNKKTINKKYRFGSINMRDRKLTLQLKPELAGERMGKP